MPADPAERLRLIRGQAIIENQIRARNRGGGVPPPPLGPHPPAGMPDVAAGPHDRPAWHHRIAAWDAMQGINFHAAAAHQHQHFR